jgi:hypothetical protein
LGSSATLARFLGPTTFGLSFMTLAICGSLAIPAGVGQKLFIISYVVRPMRRATRVVDFFALPMPVMPWSAFGEHLTEDP